jgi:hypothetical protein
MVEEKIIEVDPYHLIPLYETIANTFSSKQKENFSPNTVKNAYNNKYHNKAAETLHPLLRNMQKNASSRKS